MLSESHHGVWPGPNRLWFQDPAPERSDGTLTIEARQISYTWSFRGENQRGTILLTGPSGSLKAAWTDSWHAAEGQTLHGCFAGACLQLYGTYGAGDDSPDWGWRIILELTDPEHATLRMFNLPPDGPEVIAVDLRGARQASA